MKCIYWPVVNNQNEVPVQAFFQQLPVGVTFDTFEDTAYLYEYSNFFNKVAPFSLKEFEKLILKLQGKKDVGGKVAPSESLNPKTNVPQKKQEDNIAYDPFSAVKQVENNEDGYTTCVNCNTPLKKTAKFCSSCGAQQVKQQDKVVPKPDPIPAPKPEPTPVNDEVNLTQFVQANNGGGTVVLSFDNDVKLVPKLVSERMNNRFVINNPVFRIGSEAGSDLVISDNKYISRKHMEIVTQNDRYYAVDKGSTNKSYVSGKELTPNVAFEIFHNTEIKLANEVFTFVIEA
jgi:predicted component of type VI protein secretion system